MLVGLDIGTSKVVAVVAEINEMNSLEIIGIGSHPSRGLKNGVVIDIDSTKIGYFDQIDKRDLEKISLLII